MSLGQKLLSKISDKILIRKVRQGDRDAYGKLYMKYIDQIYRYIFFRLNYNRPESEDLTETVFIKAWDKVKLGEFRNDNFRAFLYQIAHNSIIDSYRKNNKTINLTEDIPANDSPENSYFKKTGQKELLLALNKLPDDQKQVITLKFIEGLKNEEIAKTLNKTNQAVRALQYRALNKLKKIYKHDN